MAERTIRWGILGTAKIATKVANAIHRAAGAELVGIASRSADKAQHWARQHRVRESYGAYEALLANPEIDAVYIPLPVSMHCEWTVRAALHGKHVLCEKPLAANTQEVLEMAETCRQNNVQLMDGVFWIHHERAARMRSHLEAGELGDLRRVTSAFTFHWPEVPRENIRMQKQLAGGCLGDLGYYCVLATWWALQELPIKVFATARFECDVDYHLSALLWFGDQRMASFDCGFDTGMRQWLEVAGTEGSLVCDDFVLPRNEARARYWIHDGEQRSTEHVVKDCIQEVAMIEDFCRLVRIGWIDDRWPNQALTTMRICDAIAESALTGHMIELDEEA